MRASTLLAAPQLWALARRHLRFGNNIDQVREFRLEFGIGASTKICAFLHDLLHILVRDQEVVANVLSFLPSMSVHVLYPTLQFDCGGTHRKDCMVSSLLPLVKNTARSFGSRGSCQPFSHLTLW